VTILPTVATLPLIASRSLQPCSLGSRTAYEQEDPYSVTIANTSAPWFEERMSDEADRKERMAARVDVTRRRRSAKNR
jgi:hypothetical protein